MINTRVLVAGGAGFIGSHLCERLLKDGHTVICVDNFITGTSKNLDTFKENPHFSFLNHDVTEPLPESVSADLVFHLASPASPNHHSPISYHALPMETMMVNTQGTLRLLEFSEKHKAKFLFASTSEIYGDPLEHPQKEDYRGNVSTTGPRAVYDESKRFGETLCSYFTRRRDVDTRIARIFNTYGPRMSDRDMRMSVLFILQAVQGENITIFGKGTQTRSLCYIDDLVEGLVRFMFNPDLRGSVINLGNSEERTVLEYAEIIKRITGSKSEIVITEPLPEDDPERRKPDTAKAKELLDWEPTTSLEDGLTKTIDYFRSLNH